MTLYNIALVVAVTVVSLVAQAVAGVIRRFGLLAWKLSR